MSQLMVDLKLIERIQRVLEVGMPATETTQRHSLVQITQQIRENVRHSDVAAQEHVQQLLPSYLKEHAELMVAVCDDVIEEVISYVSNVCANYQKIKSERALTKEEKAEGKELSQLLRAAMELL